MFWSCSSCDGRVATVDFLRNGADHEAVNALWQAVRTPLEPSRRVCPSCARPMRIAVVQSDAWTVPIDACATCQCVWFDRGEIERLGKRSSRAARTLSPRAREVLARAEVGGLAADAEANFDPDVETWQDVLAALGFPVVLDRAGTTARPWIVIGLVTTMLFSGLAALTTAPGLVTTLGFPNGSSFAAWCASFVGSPWVTASWWSLVPTLYFLAVFGGEVELALGRARFVGFALLAVAAGHAGFLVTEPGPDVVHVGAGALVSACLAFFVSLFPRARIYFAARVVPWLWLRFLALPAWLWFALWLATLLVQAVRPERHAMATSSLAGSLLGIGVGGLARWIERLRRGRLERRPTLRIGPR